MKLAAEHRSARAGSIDLEKKVAVSSGGFEGKNFGRRAPSKPPEVFALEPENVFLKDYGWDDSAPICPIAKHFYFNFAFPETFCLGIIGEVNIKLAAINLSAGVSPHVFSRILARIVQANARAQRQDRRIGSYDAARVFAPDAVTPSIE